MNTTQQTNYARYTIWTMLSLTCMGVFLLSGCAHRADLATVSEVGEGSNAESEGQSLSNSVLDESVGGEGGAHAASGTEELLREAAELEITEDFIDWGHEVSERGQEEIDTVIVHSVYNPFVEANKHSLEEIIEIFRGYEVAPHYIIDRDGQIVQLVADKDIAYHAGRSRLPDGRTSVNQYSIGIEMINSLEDMYTPEQYAALRMLVATLKDKYGITYVLGHDEIEVKDPWNFDWEQINDLRHSVRDGQ